MIMHQIDKDSSQIKDFGMIFELIKGSYGEKPLSHVLIIIYTLIVFHFPSFQLNGFQSNVSEAYQKKIEEPFMLNLVDSLVEQHKHEVASYINNFVIHHLHSIFPFISFPPHEFPYLSSLILLDQLKSIKPNESNFLGLRNKSKCELCKKVKSVFPTIKLPGKKISICEDCANNVFK